MRLPDGPWGYQARTRQERRPCLRGPDGQALPPHAHHRAHRDDRRLDRRRQGPARLGAGRGLLSRGAGRPPRAERRRAAAPLAARRADARAAGLLVLARALPHLQLSARGRLRQTCHNEASRACRARVRLLTKLQRDSTTWPKHAEPSPHGGATRRAAPVPAGASPARTARTRSSRSTTRTSRPCAASCPSAARSAPAGSAAPAVATRTSSPRRSSGRARSRCCPTSAMPARSAPSAVGAVAGTAAIARSASAMPEAILLKDVEALGEKGTVVEVSKGYLRNYLIPRKLAQPATKGAVDAAQRRAAAEERAAQEAVGRAAEQAELLNKTVLTISQQAGDDGRLFGSVTTQDIADAIQEARGIAIDRRKIHLDEPIKHVGTYMVVVEMADGVTANVKTMVSEQ